jgi:hypothetical protein
MNTHRFRSLIWLAGFLGCAVLADESVDSPTRAVLNSFPYQPELVAPPAAAATASRPITPEVAPGFRASIQDYSDYYALDAAIKADEKRRPDALYSWTLPAGFELKAIGRVSVQELDISWSPMTTATEVTFSPGDIGSSTSKLQARVPLLNLVW